MDYDSEEEGNGILPESRLSINAYDSRILESVSLSFEDICYSIHEKRGKEPKQLLSNISGFALPGETLAVMGPSGAGKSTLLSILAGRTMKSKLLKGRIRLNGDDISPNQRQEVFKAVSGYVMQNDCLLGSLTVKEVEEVIQALSLKHIENSRIGTQLSRGISGGERKRVSIAIELITAPHEPTTGLDSFSSMSVVNTLVQLAQEKKHTVIFTIHQPRSNIFQMFDKLLLLSNGKVVYFGPGSQVIEYFSNIGHEIPLRVNPADFLRNLFSSLQLENNFFNMKVDLVNADSVLERKQASELADKYVLSDLHEKTKNQVNAILDNNAINQDYNTGIYFKKTKRPSLFLQFKVLVLRNFLESFRNVSVIWAKVTTSIILALIMGSIFFQLNKSQDVVQDRINALFFVTVHLVLSAYTTLPRLIDERLLFNRERSSGAYSTIIYFLANLFSDLPLSALNASCFAVIAYFMVGFQPGLEHFGFFLLLLLMISLVAESICALVSAATPSFTVANGSASGILALFILFGGFCVKLSNIISFWKWVYWISFFQYGFTAAAINEFEGLTFDCNSPICPYPNGDSVLTALGIDDRDKWQCIYILASMVASFRIVNYLLLRFLFQEKN